MLCMDIIGINKNLNALPLTTWKFFLTANLEDAGQTPKGGDLETEFIPDNN